MGGSANKFDYVAEVAPSPTGRVWAGPPLGLVSGRKLVAELMMKFTVYVLRSKKSGKRYVGITAKDPEERLRQHNEGASTWTRGHRPFELVYQEIFANKAEALKRERELKSGHGREFLDKFIPR